MPDVERQPGGFQPFDEARRPVVAGEGTLGPAHEGETGVALFDEMVDRSPCAGTAVDVDPGMIVGEVTPPEGDERRSGVEQEPDPLVVVHCAGEDESIDGATTHHFPIGVSLTLTPMWREEMDVHAGIGGALGDLVQEGIEKEPVPTGRDAIADSERAPLGQGSCGAVGAVAEPVGRLDHLASGLLGHSLGGIECVGDGRDGHPGRPTHVFDRDPRAHDSPQCSPRTKNVLQSV